MPRRNDATTRTFTDLRSHLGCLPLVPPPPLNDLGIPEDLGHELRDTKFALGRGVRAPRCPGHMGRDLGNKFLISYQVMAAMRGVSLAAT